MSTSVVSDGDDSLICVEGYESPKENSSRKRKRVLEGEKSEEACGKSPKHPLLDSITHRFQQNRKERELREAVLKSKMEMEKVHSRYLQSVLDPMELSRAKYAAGHWAKRNGLSDSTLRQGQRRRNSSISRSSVNFGSPVRSATYTNNSGITSYNNFSTERGSRQTDTALKHSVERSFSPHSSRPRTELHRENSSGENFIDLTKEQSPGTKRAAIDTGNDDETEHLICPLLYCEAQFSSHGKLGQHLNLFEHSPCNPCRLAKDSKLSPDPLCYMCPQCDITFLTQDKCLEHMNKESHFTFSGPLAILAYMCPQCVHLFEDMNTCWIHMEQNNHHSYKFPFCDDDKNVEVNIPAPVAENLVRDFIRQCKRVPFQVQCLDCGEYLLNPALLRQHERETNKQHCMAALAEENVVDVFSRYVPDMTGDPSTSQAQTDNLEDKVSTNCFKTFLQFLKFTAIQLSLK